MSDQIPDKPVYSFKDWINLMEDRNVALHQYRFGSDVDINNVGDTLTYNIFNGYGYIFDYGEYNHMKNHEDYSSQFPEDIENSRLFYEYGLKNPEEVGVEAGILYASHLLYDGDTSNDTKALEILMSSSYLDRKDNTGFSPYNPSADADIILGNYHSTKDKSLALQYFNKSFEVKYDELPDKPDNVKDYAFRGFFTDAYINLLEKNEKDIQHGDPFLQELSNSLYKAEKKMDSFINGFLNTLDNRFDVKGERGLQPETWENTISTIVKSYKDGGDKIPGLSGIEIWERTEKLLDKGHINVDNVIGFLQKSTQYDNNGKLTSGMGIETKGVYIGNLYNKNLVDINKATDVYRDLAKPIAINDASIPRGYNYVLETISNKKTEKNEKFSAEEIQTISDYVASGMDGKINGNILAQTILHFDKKGYIDRDYVKGKLNKENLNEYHKLTIERRSTESKAEVAESLLAYRKVDTKYVDDILAKDKTTLHDYISQAVNDEKTSLEDKKKILDEYSKTDVYNKLSDAQKSNFEKQRSELASQLITAEKEKNKVDTLTAIINLEKAGVLTKEEAAEAKLKVLQSGEIPITDAEMTPIEVKVNGETITMDFTAAGWYDKILNFSFKNNKSGAKEIVDVVAEYGWMNNTTNKNASSEFIKQNNIPYCYAVEYRQLYNASISNIILSFLGLAYGAKGAASGVYNLAGSVIDGIIKLSSPLMQFVTGGGGDSSNKSTTLPDPSGKTNEGESATANGKTSWLEAAGNHITSFVKGADDFFTKAMEKVAYLDSRGPTATSNKSGLLNPYRMMYILSRTNKQFCFPMLDKSASAYKVANKMDEADGGQGSSLLGNRFFGMIANVAQTVLGLAQDINQIAPFFQSAIGNADSIKSMRQYHIERSKFFTFPTDGEDIEVSFILFNTVKKNIWKKHFNFIFGFVLRNLPFKHDLVSYYPPLFYDVIVPGVKRCPYCYVERVDVSPLGLMRNMSMSSEEIGLPNLTSGGSKINYTVNVPEAWQVKIVFKSLIATSGNQILSGFVDMPIQASTTNDSLKK